MMSFVSSGFLREAHLDSPEDDILFTSGEFDTTTTTAPIGAFSASSEDSACFPTCPLFARAETHIGTNRAAVTTRTTFRGTGENDGEFFSYLTSSDARATSTWVDHWTFGGTTLASAVDLTVSVDAIVSVCPGDDCSDIFGLVHQPGIDDMDVNDYAYKIFANIAVYDLDTIIEVQPEEDSDVTIEVPRQVARLAFEQWGDGGEGEFIEIEDPDGGFDEDGNPLMIEIPNGELDDFSASGTLRFRPEVGHRYATVVEVDLIAQNGVDIDAFNTMTLDQIVLSPGLTLDSFAMNELGANFNIVSTPVPVPAALPLLASALCGLGWRVRRRRESGNSAPGSC
ncbi:MAG: hypothetical protein AB7V59_10390 [Gammaproteobacteria bacterium]